MFLSADLYRTDRTCEEAVQAAADCALVPLKIHHLQAWRV
jgi:hypothetical protein